MMALKSPLWVTSPQENPCPIYIGKGLLAKPALFSPTVSGKQVFILSNAGIAKHYLASLKQSLAKAGAIQIDYLSIPSGERYKSLATAERIWSALIKNHHHRDSVLVALGGGIIGDVGGFCAACYHRGISYLQCPTSLIAQIDAAVGAKTAVNVAEIKNSVGVFYPPQAVIIDVNVLQTLPQREYIAGLAELIKYGLGFDSAFFCWLEANIDLLLRKDPKTLHYAIYKACALKAAIVSRDARDQDERLKLNLGHTVGHALEVMGGIRALRHGEAVAIGMVVAARISVLRREMSEAMLERLIGLLTYVGLPTRAPKGVTFKAILHKMEFDKKHRYQQRRFVLLQGLGSAYVAEDVSDEVLKNALKASAFGI